MWAEINAADINNQDVTVLVWQETPDLITSQVKARTQIIKDEVDSFMKDWKAPVIELADLKSELTDWKSTILLAANNTKDKSFQVALNSVPDNQPRVNPFSETKGYWDVSTDEFRKLSKWHSAEDAKFIWELYAILNELDSSNVKSDVLEEFFEMGIAEIDKESIADMFDWVIEEDIISDAVNKNRKLAIRIGYKSQIDFLADIQTKRESSQNSRKNAEKLAELNKKLWGE